MDVNSLSHTRWECKYHILFAPKFRRKVAYGELKQDIANILSMLCKRKGVEIIEAEYSQIFSKGSRIDISAFSSECIDFFLRQQTYLSVPVTSMRITLDSLVRTQPCGIQRFFLRASFFADTDGCNCACLYCLFHHYPPICTICLFSVIFSLVSKQCICGFARITRCSSSRICS